MGARCEGLDERGDVLVRRHAPHVGYAQLASETELARAWRVGRRVDSVRDDGDALGRHAPRLEVPPQATAEDDQARVARQRRGVRVAHELTEEPEPGGSVVPAVVEGRDGGHAQLPCQARDHEVERTSRQLGVDEVRSELPQQALEAPIRTGAWHGVAGRPHEVGEGVGVRPARLIGTGRRVGEVHDVRRVPARPQVGLQLPGVHDDPVAGAQLAEDGYAHVPTPPALFTEGGLHGARAKAAARYPLRARAAGPRPRRDRTSAPHRSSPPPPT